MVPALAAVLGAIARAVHGERGRDDVRIGTVTLRPHQHEALRSARAAIAEFGGALLADDPGLGKTYVALALASERPATTVVAPSALREMWRDAAARAQVAVSFVSFEALSRREPPQQHARVLGRLVVVDEAHHAGNPAAARYPRLARLTAGADVLLLSATPVRNRRAELDALLGLFLGSRAASLDDASRSRCTIRRGSGNSRLPDIDGPHWHSVPTHVDVARAIARLPPPLPALDGRAARALLAMTLARCWASSVAALDASLRRRLQRGSALDAVLEAGRMPTRAELRTWVVGDDAVQLAFPLFASFADTDAPRLQRILHKHLASVRRLREGIAPYRDRDARARAAMLARIRAAHPAARVVAFTAHAVTAEAIYRSLRAEPGVVLLTARGARSASGARPRGDVLRALGPAAPAREDGTIDDISLVLATDLLSEGVNLQGASVIVHLDVPWTPAGLDQRVGRVARLGSSHTRVHVYGLSAPAAAERLLEIARRHACKRAEGLAATAPARDVERLRELVAPWRSGESSRTSGVASVRGRVRGGVAVVRIGSRTQLLAMSKRKRRRWAISEDPCMVRACLEAAGHTSIAPDAAETACVRGALGRWLARRHARDLSGAWGGVPSAARRRVLERLDTLLARSAPDARALLRPRVSRARALVAASASAGGELELDVLSRREDMPAEDWLDDLVWRLAGPAGSSASVEAAAAHEADERPVVAWLLMISPRIPRR